jgi:hypothetical protein
MTTHDATDLQALLSFSLLRHINVVDAHGQRAPLRDLALNLQCDYPAVTGLVVGNSAAVITPADGLRLSESGRELYIHEVVSAPVSSPARDEHEVLLVRDVLDSLVIDLQQRGPARTNDIFLERDEAGLKVKAIDTGVRGIARRLTRGRWPAASGLDLSDWRYVVFLTRPRLSYRFLC